MFSLILTSILDSTSLLASLSEPALLIALGVVLFASARAIRTRVERDIDPHAR